MSFMGYDLTSERQAVQSVLGVCPQENILYDLLTVQEHFEIFWGIKSTTNDSKHT